MIKEPAPGRGRRLFAVRRVAPCHGRSRLDLQERGRRPSRNEAPAGPSSTEAPPPTANPAPPLWSLYFLRRVLQVALSSVVESEGVSMKADIAKEPVSLACPLQVCVAGHRER